ncbi:arsenite efflux transporter metallochaperone ArsD [Rhodopirellula sp. JC639]|uniref:arsenite efflux transporter metallochaperone ArsD n=1 Tax=Stieleria mannarensis TaxID=2755585 RepID=UPI00160107E8|nr:arsenite efflux transporter metallochaperone ArsD [Rhodopirellula sp. JC639]
MSTVQIYDRAMCCSTGVCGPQVDPVLPKFAADLDWLKSQGHDVQRFNLAQDAAEFTKNPTVQSLLGTEGVECLPLVIVDGRVVSRNEYPSRENLALWTGTALAPKGTLPVAGSGGCCGDTGCC